MRIAPITGTPGTGFSASGVIPRPYDINLFLKILFEEEEQFVPNKILLSTRLPESGRSDYSRLMWEDGDLWLIQGYPHPVTGERIEISGSEYLSPGHVVFARMEKGQDGEKHT